VRCHPWFELVHRMLHRLTNRSDSPRTIIATGADHRLVTKADSLDHPAYSGAMQVLAPSIRTYGLGRKNTVFFPAVQREHTTPATGGHFQSAHAELAAVAGRTGHE